MNFLQDKINGLRKRFNSLKYGMFYLRNANFKIPAKLLINGLNKEIHFNDLSEAEFTMICIDDCYQLKYLRKKLNQIRTIVDIGANQGMFLIAARQFFPQAQLAAYEPNFLLSDTLRFNAAQLNAAVYFEAVMNTDCLVNLNIVSSDLATTVQKSPHGNVPGISLKNVITRAGGSIDILKMDCEGSEWILLEEVELWSNVTALSLEYHLWGRPGATLDTLFALIDSINFRIVRHKASNLDQGFILAINKYIHTTSS